MKRKKRADRHVSASILNSLISLFLPRGRHALKKRKRKRSSDLQKRRRKLRWEKCLIWCDRPFGRGQNRRGFIHMTEKGQVEGV